MTDTLQARLAEALAPIANPRTGASIYQTQQVRDIAATRDGKVRVTLLLAAQDDPTLARQVRQALEKVEGVTDVRVDVRDSAEAPPSVAAPSAPAAPKPRGALPVMDAAPAPRTPAAPTPVAYPNLGRVIAVSSGKGGVGKSTVTTNIAIALAKAGYRVGLMDADIYGPNIPRMMGVDEAPPVKDEKIQPLVAYGVKVISLGFLIERDQPAIWRGPIVMKIITQFLRDVAWDELDLLLVDMPPGTGDAQLSLVQATNVAGAHARRGAADGSLDPRRRAAGHRPGRPDRPHRRARRLVGRRQRRTRCRPALACGSRAPHRRRWRTRTSAA